MCTTQTKKREGHVSERKKTKRPKKSPQMPLSKEAEEFLERPCILKRYKDQPMREVVKDDGYVTWMREQKPGGVVADMISDMIRLKIIKKKPPKPEQTQRTRAAQAFLNGNKKRKKVDTKTKPDAKDKEKRKAKPKKPKKAAWDSNGDQLVSERDEKNKKDTAEPEPKPKPTKKKKPVTNEPSEGNDPKRKTPWECGLCGQVSKGPLRVAMQPCGHCCLCITCHQTRFEPGFVTLNQCFRCKEKVSSLCIVRP
jgi:hypothetical protein